MQQRGANIVARPRRHAWPRRRRSTSPPRCSRVLNQTRRRSTSTRRRRLPPAGAAAGPAAAAARARRAANGRPAAAPPSARLDVRRVMAALPHRYPDAARRPGRGAGARRADRRHQGGDDQRALLPGPFPRPADHARRADRRGAGPGRRRARGRIARPRRHRASSSISWRSTARSSASPVEPGVLLRLEVEFVQKRATVCKFAGKAWSATRSPPRPISRR